MRMAFFGEKLAESVKIGGLFAIFFFVLERHNAILYKILTEKRHSRTVPTDKESIVRRIFVNFIRKIRKIHLQAGTYALKIELRDENKL